jgi:DNA (cytosine-5)-methyltransferase 1
MNKLKVGSLFTGIGGFDLGFEQAGMEIDWQCEIDPYCQTVLINNFKKEIIHDVREIGHARKIDVLCGGFPCQDISQAGQGKGLSGERSGLWYEFERIIGNIRPRWVVIENVPRLLSINKGLDFFAIISSLEQFGYCVSWRILNSQFFGVPQRRKRLYIVGSLGNARSCEVLFEQGMCGGNPAESKDKGQAPSTPARVIAYENHPNDSRITETGDISQQLTARMGTGGNNVPLVQYWDGGQISDTLDVAMLTKGQMMPEKRRMPVVMDGGVRRLTPVECERLQGFPDGWTAGVSDTQRYKQLGNAVTVNVARWIGERIVKANE